MTSCIWVNLPKNLEYTLINCHVATSALAYNDQTRPNKDRAVLQSELETSPRSSESV